MTLPLTTKQTFFALLCCGHLIGASVAVLMAAYEIESIIPSGFLFVPLGIGTAVLTRWGAPRSLAWLGLSATGLSVAVFALINLKEWGPSQAATPVGIILLAYEALALPIGLLALREILAPAADNPLAERRQFSLRTLLLTMAAVSVVLGAIKTAANWGAPVLLASATGLRLATLLGITVTLLSAVRRQPALVKSETPATGVPIAPGG